MSAGSKTGERDNESLHEDAQSAEDIRASMPLTEISASLSQSKMTGGIN
jgi:hypothetical protein